MAPLGRLAPAPIILFCEGNAAPLGGFNLSGFRLADRQGATKKAPRQGLCRGASLFFEGRPLVGGVLRLGARFLG
ncbi:MAG TPA: hypothetical protein VKI45_10965, partial [Allosphingosinicella sp.]|nr:hypothetical protein [Allosphingosinicella sp.]